LDFTSRKLNVGSKMGINAVRRANNSDRKKRKIPETVPDPREKLDQVLDYRLLPGGFLVLKVKEKPKDAIRRIFDLPGYKNLKIVAVVSADIDIHDDTELIWGIFTRFDPYLDVIFEETELKGSAVVYNGRMGIDASFKEWYPEVIEMSEDVKGKVSKRWKEYWTE
jgi:3-polyprenyl-4-hydroxybenzoate decarboxylase